MSAPVEPEVWEFASERPRSSKKNTFLQNHLHFDDFNHFHREYCRSSELLRHALADPQKRVVPPDEDATLTYRSLLADDMMYWKDVSRIPLGAR